MGEVIVITSGKGGVGKTTTTANIGTGLAQMDKKVILIDTDIGLRNLDVVMGLENRIVYNLVDVIEGNCRLKQAVIRDRKYPNLYLIPSAQTKDKTAVNPEQMKKLTEELKDEFDYILLDCPAGIFKCDRGCDKSNSSDYSGSLSNPGCRPCGRTFRSSRDGTDRTGGKPYQDRYGQTGRHDVVRRCL